MGLNIKKWFKEEDEDVFSSNGSTNQYYNLDTEEALRENDGNSKMILLEPRAYSESQQIADHLKNRHTVVVNLKRVTTDQAKRIVDFLSGAIYALGGSIQRIANNIYLIAPYNVTVLGDFKDELTNKGFLWDI